MDAVLNKPACLFIMAELILAAVMWGVLSPKNSTIKKRGHMYNKPQMRLFDPVRNHLLSYAHGTGIVPPIERWHWCTGTGTTPLVWYFEYRTWEVVVILLN